MQISIKKQPCLVYQDFFYIYITELIYWKKPMTLVQKCYQFFDPDRKKSMILSFFSSLFLSLDDIVSSSNICSAVMLPIDLSFLHHKSFSIMHTVLPLYLAFRKIIASMQWHRVTNGKYSCTTRICDLTIVNVCNKNVNQKKCACKCCKLYVASNVKLCKSIYLVLPRPVEIFMILRQLYLQSHSIIL